MYYGANFEQEVSSFFGETLDAQESGQVNAAAAQEGNGKDTQGGKKLIENK